MNHVYILKLMGPKFYVGTTNNLEKRMLKHTNGRVSMTKGKRPQYQSHISFPTAEQAYAWEAAMHEFIRRDTKSTAKTPITFKRPSFDNVVFSPASMLQAIANRGFWKNYASC